MKLLVALDFSDAMEAVLREGQKLARALSAEICLLHAAEPDPDFVGYGVGPQVVRDQVAHGFREEHSRLQHEAKVLRDAGLTATPLLVQGPAAQAILQEAERLQADLIVVGSHGHGPVHQLLVGGVSEGVLRRARCPVLVVPTHGRP
jgi:nucleotide-binding universal stress UspA family protein